MSTSKVNTLVVPFDIAGDHQTFEFGLSSEEYSFGIDSAVQIVETTDMYDGAYDVTPSGEAQMLFTENKIMAANVVINPIPSNYGRITWNGSVLTVS